MTNRIDEIVLDAGSPMKHNVETTIIVVNIVSTRSCDDAKKKQENDGVAMSVTLPEIDF